MDARARTETVTTQVSGALAGSGVVVDDVSVQSAGRRRLVRVFLARDVSGLDPADTTSTVEPLSLDEVAEATRTVSQALDASDVMGEAPYTLEVGSPGLDRPLTTHEQFRRNVGRLLVVTLAGDGGTAEGRLTQVRADGIHLEGARAGGGADIAWEDLTRALVQVEFTRADGKDD